MKDEAQAITEVAKTTGKAIDAGREFGGFIARFVGGPLTQAMGIVEDRLKYLRWERQVRMMVQAERMLSERGLSGPTRQVPLNIAIPLLQGGSLEESDALQDRWASLLVNAADAEADIEVRRSFISILEDLTPQDALVLEKVYEVQQDRGEDLDAYLEQAVWTTFLPDRATQEQPETENLRPSVEVELALANLARLGLITTGMTWAGSMIFSCVHRTVLGREFVRACSRSRR